VIRELVEGKLPWPLSMLGSVGTGKTCAALCLLDYAGGDYWTATDWANTLSYAREGRYTIDEEGQTRRISPIQMWQRCQRLPLFVLDEIGLRSRASDHQYESVKGVIDARKGKPLVVISNLDLPGLEKVYDDRITDRLIEGTVFLDQNPSRRMQEKTS
jgi:DNA replication protein DnaC